MSADLMRRAATRMRDLADGATSGPWRVGAEGSEGSRINPATGDKREDSHWIASVNGRVQPEDGRNAAHMASWDPAVARAAADLLDAGADEIERRVERDGEQILQRANPVFHAMTELARTYLHEEG